MQIKYTLLTDSALKSMYVFCIYSEKIIRQYFFFQQENQCNTKKIFFANKRKLMIDFNFCFLSWIFYNSISNNLDLRKKLVIMLFTCVLMIIQKK